MEKSLQVENTHPNHYSKSISVHLLVANPRAPNFNVGGVVRMSVLLAIIFSFQNPLARFNIKIWGKGVNKNH